MSVQRIREEHVVGNLADFPEREIKLVRIGGRQIGIFNIGGVLYGLPNLCPHQTGPLCEGNTTTGTLASRKENNWRLEWTHDGEIVTCPWHGLEYHVPTGKCLAFPQVRLRTYEVVVEHGEVKVRI